MSLRSDSSMDDKDHRKSEKRKAGKSVQIPLWTIRTKYELENGLGLYQFRFLYGR